MLKRLTSTIQKLEQQRKTKVDKIAEIQMQIDEIDVKLKKLYAFKREYEKLMNNSTEYLNNIK